MKICPVGGGWQPDVGQLPSHPHPKPHRAPWSGEWHVRRSGGHPSPAAPGSLCGTAFKGGMREGEGVSRGSRQAFARQEKHHASRLQVRLKEQNIFSCSSQSCSPRGFVRNCLQGRHKRSTLSTTSNVQQLEASQNQGAGAKAGRRIF